MKDPSIAIIRVILVLFVSVSLGAVDAVPGSFPLINQSHHSPVTATAHSTARSLAFSGSVDGVLKVWDTDNAIMLQRIQISSEPIIMIAANPNRDEVALIEEGSAGEYRLSVWNWVDQRLGFARTIEDLPIFLEYSPRGSFLTMALPQWRSLRFFDTARARELNYLPEGFGIVNFAEVAGSEARIMTYSANNGRIRYLEINNATLNHETQTVRNLSEFTLLANRRYALAMADGILYLLDVVNGATLARTEAGNVSEIITVDPESNSFYLAVEAGDRHRLYPAQVVISGNSASIEIEPTESLGISGISGQFSRGEANGVFANNDGNIGYIRDGSFTLMGLNATSTIQSVHVLSDRLYLLSNDNVSRMPLAVLNQLEDDDLPDDFAPQVERISLPIGRPGGMITVGSTRMLIWDQENPELLVEYNTLNGAVRTIQTRFNAPVRQIRSGNQYLIVIDDENGLYLLDPSTYQQEFSYNTLGLIDALELANGQILIGKNRSGFFNSSLIQVNPRTSETQTLNSPDTVVFGFAEQTNGRGFYSIGISNEGSRPATVVREFSNGNPTQSRSIMRFTGEDSDAYLAFNSTNNSLVTSAGLEGVSLYQSRRLVDLEKNNNLPRQVFGSREHIFSINADGSLSVWNNRTRQLSHQLIALPNGDVVILTPEASYLALETVPGRALLDYRRLLVPIIPRGESAPRLEAIPTRSLSAGALPATTPQGTPGSSSLPADRNDRENSESSAGGN